MRFGLEIHGLTAKCDGCGADFTIAHALNGKVGGLPWIRHRDLNGTWQHICSQAFAPSSVSHEPLIQSNVDKKRTGKGRERPVQEQLERL